MTHSHYVLIPRPTFFCVQFTLDTQWVLHYALTQENGILITYFALTAISGAAGAAPRVEKPPASNLPPLASDER